MSQTPSPAVAQLIQQRGSAPNSLRADPAQVEGDGPTFGDVWRSTIGGTLTQAGLDQLARRDAVLAGGIADPEFNPYEFITANKSLASDPAISYLAERGQFDRSRTPEQFDFDLQQGRRFLEDMDTIQRSTRLQFYTAMAGAIVGDPANLIPGGVAVKGVNAAKQVGNLQRIGRIAALGGSLNLAAEVGVNRLNPASNEPGISNEIFATLAGATFGAGIGTITTPGLGNMPNRWLSTRRHKQLRKNFDTMIEAPAVRQVDPSQPTVTDNLTLTTLNDELAANQKTLADMLNEDPSELGSVTVLNRKGDQNDALIGQLKKKYDDAGGQLVVHRHPDQDFYDLAEDVRSIMDHPNMNAEATAADLDYGLLDTVTSAVTTKYTGAQRIVTPGGRLAGNTLGRLQDAYRTLSGSAQTVTKAQAQGKFDHASGTSAEALKSLYDGAKDLAVFNLRRTYRAARKDGAITYNGQSIEGIRGYGEFRRSVNDLMRREHAQSRGFDVEIPADVHPSIRSAVDESRNYLLRMRDELETTGMLEVGPKAQAKVQADLDARRDAVAQMNVRVEAARANGTEGQIDFGGYSATAVRNRIDQSLADMPSMADEVDAIAASLSNDFNDLDVSLPDGFGFTPDELEHLSATDRAKIAQRYPIAEDYAGYHEYVDERMRQRVINEIIGGKKGRIENQAQSILESPDYHEPDVVLDAYLHQVLSTTRSEARGGKHVTINPRDLKAGDDFTMYGRDFDVVEDGGQLLAKGEDFEFFIDEFSRVPVAAHSIKNLDIETDAATLNQSRRSDQLDRKLARLRRQEQATADHLDKVSAAVAGQEKYLPRVFNVAAVMGNEAKFKDTLARSFRRFDSIVDGKTVADDSRPLIREVAENLPAERFDNFRETPEGEIALPVDYATITEGQLDPATQVAYRSELEAYYRRTAKASFDKITAPTERHGVADGFNPDPVKRRVLEVDESELQDFLEQDIETILERYQRVVGGRVAVRRAIQLNPDKWEGVTLKDGTPITDGDSLFNYLQETGSDLERWGEHADRAAGVASSGPAAVAARKIKTRIERDFRMPLDMIEGRTTAIDAKGLLPYLGRNGTRLQYINKLGSVFWAQLNDLAPTSLYMMQRPQSIRSLGSAIKFAGHKDISRRDLEVLGIGFDGITRARALADVDDAATGRGVGEGMMRSVTAKVEDGMLAAGDLHGRLSLMNWITDTSKRISGTLVLDRVTDQSKRLIRANALIASGVDEKAALRQVGLHAYDAARVNKLGLNVDRAKRYHELVYDNGYLSDDTPIREAMSFDEYMVSKKPVKAGFDDWPTPSQADRDMLDTLFANLNAEVNRNMVVTPGAFDRPIINFNVFGRIFNQFQSFGMAFINQRMAVMSQMPAKYQAWYGMSYLGMGAMSDAIANHLSGRRSLSESGEMWKTNPMGMTYTAFERAGLGGWIGRGMAYSDMLGFGPGTVLGNTTGSTAARRVTGDNAFVDIAGPLAGDAAQALNITSDLLKGEPDTDTAYKAWKLAPFQNLIWLRMLNNTTGAPVVPQALKENQ